MYLCISIHSVNSYFLEGCIVCVMVWLIVYVISSCTLCVYVCVTVSASSGGSSRGAATCCGRGHSDGQWWRRWIIRKRRWRRWRWPNLTYFHTCESSFILRGKIPCMYIVSMYECMLKALILWFIYLVCWKIPCMYTVVYMYLSMYVLVHESDRVSHTFFVKATLSRTSEPDGRWALWAEAQLSVRAAAPLC